MVRERSQGITEEGCRNDCADAVQVAQAALEQQASPRIVSDLTVVVAFDEEYVAKLRQSWPTWMAFRPWIREIPVLLIYDAELDLQCVDLSFLGTHPNVRLVPWSMPDAKTQRERMLTALVHVPAREVQTNWYLKLDADTYATRSTKWVYDEWFGPIDDEFPPVWVASPWGYTKPANTIAKLDEWGG